MPDTVKAGRRSPTLGLASDSPSDAHVRIRWLDRPLSGLSCVLSWALATGIFIGAVALFGGPSEGDATESLYATWAIGHGDFACSNPPITNHNFLLDYGPGPHAPPLWPLISGGLDALTRIGHAVPFPSQRDFGNGCAEAYSSMYRWGESTYALVRSVGLGYVAWFALLAGLVAVVRAAGRGRRGWEALTVLFVAALPMVWAPLLEFYHPQDLLAMGLALGGLACVLRQRWIWAGVLIGLAVTSQQFALLVLIPLVIVASGRRRWLLLGSSAGAWALVSLPFLIVTSGQAWGAIFYGTGDARSLGGTVLSALGLPATLLHFSSRLLPFAFSVLVALWVWRRVGERALAPVPLISLVATSLCMRLVFEQGIFGYKFMALSVMLVVLDVVRGQIRGSLVAWLALVTVGFSPIPKGLDFNARGWGAHAVVVVQLLVIACSLAMLIWLAAHRRRPPWYLVAVFVVAACAFLQWPPWTIDTMRQELPRWVWQMLLVSTGLVLAAGPLVRSNLSHGSDQVSEARPNPLALSETATQPDKQKTF